MPSTCRYGFARTFTASGMIVAWSIWSLASSTPLVAQPLEFPLGLATGSGEAQISHNGKQWVALSVSSSPVYDNTMIRTGKGFAAALLKDGTQLELQPRSVVGISGSRTAPVVKIGIGRVLFRLPASSRTALVTPSVQYRVARTPTDNILASIRVAAVSPNSFDAVGEIVINQRGGSRIELRQGEVLAGGAGNDPGLHIIKAGQSVDFPQTGVVDPNWSTMLAQALPGDAAGEAGAGFFGTGAGAGGVGATVSGVGGLAGAVGGAVGAATGGPPASEIIP